MLIDLYAPPPPQLTAHSVCLLPNPLRYNPNFMGLTVLRPAMWGLKAELIEKVQNQFYSQICAASNAVGESVQEDCDIS